MRCIVDSSSASTRGQLVLASKGRVATRPSANRFIPIPEQPPGSMHPYGPTGVPPAVHVPNMSAARSVMPPLQSHVPLGAAVAPVHPAARAMSPVDIGKVSPRASALVTPDVATVPADAVHPILQKLSVANEQTWLAIGSAADTMEDYQRALVAYDSALFHNPYSVAALSAMASVYRALDHFEAVRNC